MAKAKPPPVPKAPAPPPEMANPPTPHRFVAVVVGPSGGFLEALDGAAAALKLSAEMVRYRPPYPMSVRYRFTRYLTLAEQIESVLRYHGAVGEDAVGRAV